MMTINQLTESLLALSRERDKEISARDFLIVRMGLELRALNMSEDAINNEINEEEADRSSEIGRRSRRVNELDLLARDLYAQRYFDALVERGKLLMN
jgi:hypothetical protein